MKINSSEYGHHDISESQYWVNNPSTATWVRRPESSEVERSREIMGARTRGPACKWSSSRGSTKGPCHSETVNLLQGGSAIDAEGDRLDLLSTPDPERCARFKSLTEDADALSLLKSMKQDSDRIRRLQANRSNSTDTTPYKPENSEIQWLKDEVEDLRREREMLRFLVNQKAPASPSSPTRNANVDETQLLLHEANILRRENESFRLQLPRLSPDATPPNDAPPPYTPSV